MSLLDFFLRYSGILLFVVGLAFLFGQEYWLNSRREQREKAVMRMVDFSVMCRPPNGSVHLFASFVAGAFLGWLI